MGASTQPVVNTRKLKACLSAIFNSLFSRHENMLHDVANVKTTGRLPQDRVTKSRGNANKKQKAKNMKRYTSKHPNRYFMNLFLKFALDGCLLVDKDYARRKQEPSLGSLRTIFLESAS